jgi:hypothetical protein
MSEPLFVEEEHPLSKRGALVCNERHSIWLYITESGETTIAGDCWLFNIVETPDNLGTFVNEDGPPPATAKFVGPGARVDPPASDQISFRWSSDGHSVAAIIGTEPVGFIAPANGGAFSMHLRAAGPFGQPFDSSLYNSLFGAQ